MKVFSVLTLLLLSSPAFAIYSASPPNAAEVENMSVTTESGTETISELTNGQHPMLLVPAYYNCNSTCPLLAENLKQTILSANALRALDVLFVSFNSDDDLAAMKKFREHHALPPEWKLAVIKNPNRAKDFLTQFQYVYQKTDNGFDHPNAAFVLSPSPRVWTGSLFGSENTQEELKAGIDTALLASRTDVKAQIQRVFGKREYIIAFGIVGTVTPLLYIAWFLTRRRRRVVVV